MLRLRPAPAALALLVALLCGRAGAEIEFVGVLATSRFTRFALGDTTTHRTDWVARGDTFAGYTVRAYDAEADTITLARADVTLRLRLKDDAKVKPARLELAGVISFGADEKVEVSRATLLFDQDNVFPLKDGVTYRIRPQPRDDGTIRYGISVERTLAQNKTERISTPAVVTLPGQKFSLQIDNLGFSFTPKFP